MKYDIYIGQNRHYCVISKKYEPEEAICFIANKWKVAKRNLKIDTGWIKREHFTLRKWKEQRKYG